MLLLLLLQNAFLLLPWAVAGRIIGGREVYPPHARPYMAYLQIKNDSHTFSCGGFLIRPDALLSAAHCVCGKGTVLVTVILGAHNIGYQEPSQQKIRVEHWVIHPNYSDYKCGNDIVLLKLETKAKITKYVKPISLPSHNGTVTPETKCIVSGWGQTSKKGCQTTVMREVDLKLLREDICEMRFKRTYKHQSMICAGDMNGRKSTYKGDSGGPLVCNGKAHGIVSYGHEDSPFPEVFTRVSYFEPWINEQLKKFASQELPGSTSSD